MPSLHSKISEMQKKWLSKFDGDIGIDFQAIEDIYLT
jgi:hypothetical protein